MAGRKGLREKELEKEGWIKQTTIGEPRLSEIVEVYRSLGYEVRLEPVELDGLDEECRKCFELEGDKVKTVYVRKRSVSQLFHPLYLDSPYFSLNTPNIPKRIRGHR